MSHQDSSSIWDHSRTVATNSCLGSQQDVFIDERISDLGLFMQDEHITVSCCILSSSIFGLTLNDVNINKGQLVGAKICDAWAPDCTVYVFVGGDHPTDAGVR